MTVAPSTPVEVVQHLSALTGELRDRTAAYRLAEKDAATKRHHADMVEARAYLRADGPVEERKRRAATHAEVEEGQALVAEALVRVLKAEIREIETRIEVGRTYGATVRAELKTLSYEGTP